MPTFKQAPPKYVQMADHLRDQIVRGALRPGDEVPSERQLAADWEVARPTATKALDVLRREGLLAGRQGSGTYVTEPSALRRQADDRYVRSRQTGRIYLANERAEILRAELAEAPEHVAQALGVPTGSSVVRRERLTLRDDKPVELSTSWFAGVTAEVAPLLLEAERILEGTLSYVEASTGRTATIARDRVSARLATDEERELLQLPDPCAVVVTRHTVLDADDLVLDFTESVGPPDTWNVEHEYPLAR